MLTQEELKTHVHYNPETGVFTRLTGNFKGRVIKNKPDQLFASVGYFHHNDLATQTTPITVLPDTLTVLTNDSLGAQTNLTGAPYGVINVFDSTIDSFDFSELSIGDTIDLRVDLLLSTASVNQTYNIFLRVGDGGAEAYDLPVFSGKFKDVETFERIVGSVGFSLDYESHITNLSFLYIISDDDASVKVNGWYTRILRKSVNIVDITGIDTFLELTDTPSTYAGQAGKAVVVNDDEDAVEFVEFPSGGGSTFKQLKGFYTDFVASNQIGTASEMPNIALASGTVDYNKSTISTFETGHVGIVAIKSSGNINSGFSFFKGAIVNNGDNHTFFSQFKIISNTNTKGYIGFHASTTTATPTSSCWLDVVNGTAQFKTRQGATETASSSFSLSENVWYNLFIEFISTTEVLFKIKTDAGVLVSSYTSTTNLPAYNVSTFSSAVTYFSTVSTTARELIWLDYVEYRTEKPNHLKDF
jgi:hypothetical protein